jgi:soluble lytic murein transglycosylase-like protein
MDYIELARSKAEKYGLDPGIFERMIRQESQFNPDAVSERGGAGHCADHA